MFDTLGLICMIWWYPMLFHPLHADIQCMESDAQESPITNVNVDRRKMELFWESSGNLSVCTCTIMDRDMKHIDMEVDSSLCSFPVEILMPLHKGVSFIIKVPNTNISKQCTFLPEGMNGSAIENFSCVIYSIFLMNCTWQAGRDAPADTQYFLYWRNSREDNQMECELYIKDENHRNMGCIFQNVSIGTEKAYFLVNGSSKDSLIQFYDEFIDLYKIEKLMPPSNITVNCDEIKNDCIIQWQQPQISHSDKDMCFKYDINIKYKDNPKGKPIYISIQEGGNSNVFLRSNTRKKYVLKMRAAGSACLVNPAWGEWSAPVEFGNEEIISSSVWLLLGVAVATPLMAIITFFICKRTGCWKVVFPQIPGPKPAFFTLADTNPELMDGKIQSTTSENGEIVLVADTMR